MHKLNVWSLHWCFRIAQKSVDIVKQGKVSKMQTGFLEKIVRQSFCNNADSKGKEH